MVMEMLIVLGVYMESGAGERVRDKLNCLSRFIDWWE